jgi:hypothetical protein
MIWTALLMSITGFCWYLITAIDSSTTGNNIYLGIVLLLVISFAPTLTGYASNSRLLLSNPTVLRIITANALFYAVYIALVAIAGLLFSANSDVFQYWPLGRQYFVPACIWQFICWAIGSYYAIKSKAATAERPSNLKAAGISVSLMIPAIFLLTFKGIPVSLCLIIIGLWFLALTLTLALEGNDIKIGPVFHYELVFSHALVSLAVAVMLFFIAFFGQVRRLLLAAQQGILTLWYLFGSFMDWLLSKLPDVEADYLDRFILNYRPEREIARHSLSRWFLVPLAFLAIPLILSLIRALVRVLRMRMNSRPLNKAGRFSVFKMLVRLGRCIIRLVASLYDLIRTFAIKLFAGIGHMIVAYLPAKTPYQKVYRCYLAFLRWGRKYGLSRKPAETPSEYALRLKRHFGDKPCPIEEIYELTSIFLEAHYRNSPIDWDQGHRSYTLLRKIRSF